MRRLISLFVAAIVIAGCEKAPVDNDPDSYRLKGTLSGKVIISDYRTPPESAAGATVRVEGTSYKGIADSTGHWAINDLPAGTYILSFEKEGFATFREFNITYAGGGELRLRNIYTLARIPSEFSVANFRIDSIVNSKDRAGIYLNADISPTPPSGAPLGIQAFIGRDTLADITNWSQPGYLSTRLERRSGEGSLEGTISIDLDDIYKAGFKSGDALYIFPVVADQYTFYHDPFQEREIYSAIGPRSAAVRFLLP